MFWCCVSCLSLATTYLKLYQQAPLCHSNNTAAVASTLIVPPPPDAVPAADEHHTSVRQNGVSGAHLSVLDSSVFLNGRAKQLPARIKFYEFYNAPITKFWAHSVRFLVSWCYWIIINSPHSSFCCHILLSSILTIVYFLRELCFQKSSYFRYSLDLILVRTFRYYQPQFLWIYIYLSKIRLV